MAELVTGVREGDILVQKYRIERVLGAGAMGVVVAAYHLGLDTRVAIKLLHPQMLENEEVVARFAREARAAAKITGEHVARVLDVGVLETGASFIVMELLEGADLQKWLQRHGPLPIAQAIDFVLQASEAIAEAHRLGIVHRDLKPSNLFCVPRADGTLCVKVVDFGISKMSSGGASSSISMTRTAALIGTPLYMSPEQMESSRSVDARADVWALGVILFELLAGTSPFFGETLPEVCLKIATRAPPPMQDLRPDVPKQLEAAILKSLEKDREKRWQTVADFCLAIAPHGPARAEASAERIRRTTHSVSAADSDSAVLGSPLAWQPSPPTLAIESMAALGSTSIGRSRRKTGILGVLVVIVGIALALTLFVTRMNGHGRQLSTAPAAASASPIGTVAVPSPSAAVVVPPPRIAEPVVERAIDPASGAPVVDAAPRDSATARSRRTPSAATAHVHPSQASAQPEPAKGSPYDERL